MCKDGYFLLWNHIRQHFKEELECDLHLVPKITSEHINLSPFSVMNVRLAAQVLSSSVSVALATYGPAEARETAKYCYMFDKYCDCMNSRNTTEAHRKQKPDLAHDSEDDKRFGLLVNTFLAYLQTWKKSIESTPNITASQKAKMFISWQTYETLQINIHSTIELIRYILSHGVEYVLTGRFCQDPLENYFVRQRSMGYRRDNPNLRTFGYQDNTIRSSKIFRPIAGNCLS